MKKYVGFILSLAIGALGGATIGLYTDFDYLFGHPVSFVIYILVGLIGGLYVQLALHEAGHLVFGLFSGYSFQSYRIGSLMWINRNGSIQFKRYELAGTGGQCLMGPPQMKDGKIPVTLYNLGGILANGIVSVLCLLLYLCIKNPLLQSIVLMWILFGILMFLTNGIPMKMGGVANDGYNVFYLSKDMEAVKAFYKQMKIAELLSQGVRYKDMPKELFLNRENADLTNVLIVSVEVFHCNRFMDAHQFEQAYQKMNDLLQKETGMLEVHRNQLINDCIFCEYLMDQDYTSRLSKEFKRFLKSMKKNPSILRTQMILEKDFYVLSKEFEKVAKTYPYVSELETEREFISMIQEKGDYEK